MKLANFICLVVLAGLCYVAVERGCDKPGVVPTVGADTVLITYDVNKKPGFLNEQKLLDTLDAHPGKGHYRIVESTATFGSDQPEFKALKPDATMPAPDWIVFGKGTDVVHGEALPATEAPTESIIKEYAK